MQEFIIKVKGKTHPVLLKDSLLAAFPELLAELKLSSPLYLVTDSRVKRLYGDQLKRNLKAAGFQVKLWEVPRGERAKSLTEVKKLYQLFLEARLDRSCRIIALGGGVLTDLVGFAAATFLRGIPLILIPTTFLAQVDAAVGGKNGVNLPEGKNLIGSFYFPELVLIDPTLLLSLEEKEFLNGVAEVIKAALLDSEEFLKLLEENSPTLKSQQGEILSLIIQKAVEFKVKVVNSDPFELGKRAILNLGHTLGHALESGGRFRLFSHGEAVSLGMRAALKLSEQMLNLNPQTTQRLELLLKEFSLPAQLKVLNNQEIFNPLSRDKKKSGKLKMVLLKAVGEPVVTDCPPLGQLAEILDYLRQDKDLLFQSL